MSNFESAISDNDTVTINLKKYINLLKANESTGNEEDKTLEDQKAVARVFMKFVDLIKRQPSFKEDINLVLTVLNEVANQENVMISFESLLNPGVEFHVGRGKDESSTKINLDKNGLVLSN